MFSSVLLWSTFSGRMIVQFDSLGPSWTVHPSEMSASDGFCIFNSPSVDSGHIAIYFGTLLTQFAGGTAITEP